MRRGPEDPDRGEDRSGLPPLPVGAPNVTPLQAAAGVGYGFGFAGNSHHVAPGGMLRAVKYLVEEAGQDVNAVDADGNTALHHAASRGDNEMILYLVAKGADVTRVNRAGQTTVDLANGPVQRVQPFPARSACWRSSVPATITAVCPVEEDDVSNPVLRWRGLVTISVLFVALPAFAQIEQARLNGTVTDAQGGVLPGVTVTVRSPALIGAPVHRHRR